MTLQTEVRFLSPVPTRDNRMIRECPKCGPKDESCFNKKTGDRLQSLCRECSNKTSADHYQNNKDLYKLRKRTHREIVRNYINDFKKDKPCADCGIVYPLCVMEFDHQRDKRFEIAVAATRGYSLESVKAEIEKCELVCANCHRIRTHQPEEL